MNIVNIFCESSCSSLDTLEGHTESNNILAFPKYPNKASFDDTLGVGTTCWESVLLVLQSIFKEIKFNFDFGNKMFFIPELWLIFNLFDEGIALLSILPLIFSLN